jgi:hypothetical protein
MRAHSLTARIVILKPLSVRLSEICPGARTDLSLAIMAYNLKRMAKCSGLPT